jgi:hypothetical protein
VAPLLMLRICLLMVCACIHVGTSGCACVRACARSRCLTTAMMLFYIYKEITSTKLHIFPICITTLRFTAQNKVSLLLLPLLKLPRPPCPYFFLFVGYYKAWRWGIAFLRRFVKNPSATSEVEVRGQGDTHRHIQKKTSTENNDLLILLNKAE